MPAFNIACFLIYAWMANGLGFYETIEDVGSSPFHSPEKLMIALLFHLKKKERKKENCIRLGPQKLFLSSCLFYYYSPRVPAHWFCFLVAL